MGLPHWIGSRKEIGICFPHLLNLDGEQLKIQRHWREDSSLPTAYQKQTTEHVAGASFTSGADCFAAVGTNERDAL